jgi:hypothetical protein
MHRQEREFLESLDAKLDAILLKLDDLATQEAFDMSKLSDGIATASASADQAITRVTATVTDLTAQIAALQAIVDSGGATPADLQAIADLQAKLDGLDPTKPTTITPAVVAAAKASSGK